LGESEHEYRSEPSREQPQEPGTERALPRRANPVAEELSPVRLVTTFRLSQGKQYLPFLALPPPGEIPVDSSLGLLIG
jgi:hypothetical protein